MLQESAARSLQGLNRQESEIFLQDPTRSLRTIGEDP